MTAAPPAGFTYRPDVVPADEERGLLHAIRALPFDEIRLRGQVARRRSVHFGWRYAYASSRIEPGPPMPDFLLPLRARCGALTGVDPDRFAEALINEYPPGAGIGWHRDAPMFDVVVGVSLGSACRFRFEHGAGRDRQTRVVVLEPRSAYVLDGDARWQWRHAVPPTRELRYSVTFRTMTTAWAPGPSLRDVDPGPALQGGQDRIEHRLRAQAVFQRR